MTACPDVQIIAARTRLHTAVPEWLNGSFHRIAPIATEYRKHFDKNRHSCHEFWICLALSGGHRLHHLRLPWHMPTKRPWAYNNSTCCVCGGTGDLKTPGLIGLELDRLEPKWTYNHTHSISGDTLKHDSDVSKVGWVLTLIQKQKGNNLCQQ